MQRNGYLNEYQNHCLTRARKRLVQIQREEQDRRASREVLDAHFQTVTRLDAHTQQQALQDATASERQQASEDNGPRRAM